MRTKVLGTVLVLLALFQASMLWSRLSARPARATPPAFLAVGDTIPPLRVRLEDGRWARYRPGSAGEWTLVMAYRSTCAPSQAVAPAWQRWLSTPRSVRVVAMTRDSLPAAIAYRSRQRWAIPVLSVEGVQRGSPEHALVTRTPWFFLVDPSGVVRHQGQGGELPALDSAIARYVPAPAAARPPERPAGPEVRTFRTAAARSHPAPTPSSKE
ncbi:MAG TPA: hypothetical protein VF142_21960 [Longimicrobium sp.]